MSFKPFVPVLLCGSLLGGCATVTRGTSDTVVFDSLPQGAKAIILEGSGLSDPIECITPCQVVLSKSSSYAVRFEMEGYETLRRGLTPRYSNAGGAATIGNSLLIYGAGVGIGVDAMTGAMNDLKPNPMLVELVPTAPAAEYLLEAPLVVSPTEDQPPASDREALELSQDF